MLVRMTRGAFVLLSVFCLALGCGDGNETGSSQVSKIAFAGIYVMDADGSNQTGLMNGNSFGDDPSWSPDGNQIAFSSDRDGNYEIYVMN